MASSDDVYECNLDLISVICSSILQVQFGLNIRFKTCCSINVNVTLYLTHKKLARLKSSSVRLVIICVATCSITSVDPGLINRPLDAPAQIRCWLHFHALYLFRQLLKLGCASSILFSQLPHNLVLPACISGTLVESEP